MEQDRAGLKRYLFISPKFTLQAALILTAAQTGGGV
jgi:hypothetical protein